MGGFGMYGEGTDTSDPKTDAPGVSTGAVPGDADPQKKKGGFFKRIKGKFGGSSSDDNELPGEKAGRLPGVEEPHKGTQATVLGLGAAAGAAGAAGAAAVGLGGKHDKPATEGILPTGNTTPEQSSLPSASISGAVPEIGGGYKGPEGSKVGNSGAVPEIGGGYKGPDASKVGVSDYSSPGVEAMMPSTGQRVEGGAAAVRGFGGESASSATMPSVQGADVGAKPTLGGAVMPEANGDIAAPELGCAPLTGPGVPAAGGGLGLDTGMPGGQKVDTGVSSAPSFKGPHQAEGGGLSTAQGPGMVGGLGAAAALGAGAAVLGGSDQSFKRPGEEGAPTFDTGVPGGQSFKGDIGGQGLGSGIDTSMPGGQSLEGGIGGQPVGDPGLDTSVPDGQSFKGDIGGQSFGGAAGIDTSVPGDQSFKGDIGGPGIDTGMSGGQSFKGGIGGQSFGGPGVPGGQSFKADVGGQSFGGPGVPGGQSFKADVGGQSFGGAGIDTGIPGGQSFKGDVGGQSFKPSGVSDGLPTADADVGGFHSVEPSAGTTALGLQDTSMPSFKAGDASAPTGAVGPAGSPPIPGKDPNYDYPPGVAVEIPSGVEVTHSKPHLPSETMQPGATRVPAEGTLPTADGFSTTVAAVPEDDVAAPSAEASGSSPSGKGPRRKGLFGGIFGGRKKSSTGVFQFPYT
jgi:hypothetical protein